MTTTAAKGVTIRHSKIEDMKLWKSMNDEIGWDVSMYEHLAYMRIDPDYLLVAVDESNEPVGFCGGCRHTSDTMYICSFIVRKDLRGKGIGKLLWKAVMAKVGDMNVVLDAASKMEDWYLKNGFPIKSFKVRFCRLTVSCEIIGHVDSKYDIATLSEDMWPDLMQYDRQVYPNIDRTSILRAWFTGDNVRVAAAFDSGKIVGYGAIHKKPEQRNEYGVRNLFADNEEVAEAIFGNLLAGLADGSVVRVVILEGKRLPKYEDKMIIDEETARRMFSKHKIETDFDKMWIGMFTI